MGQVGLYLTMGIASQKVQGLIHRAGGLSKLLKLGWQNVVIFIVINIFKPAEKYHRHGEKICEVFLLACAAPLYM